jgi:hypothetical protein
MMAVDMGLLIDIETGKRGAAGPGAIIFWGVAGAAIGIATAWMVANLLPTSLLYLLAGVGEIFGLVVGFYAAWGTSVLARILAVPGIIVDVLSGLVA